MIIFISDALFILYIFAFFVAAISFYKYIRTKKDGPIKIKDKDGMDKNYYDISYSVKTIDPAWIAGNGKNEGLWVNNKSGFFVLIKNFFNFF